MSDEMKLEDVHTLLEIADLSTQWPELRDIHNKAMRSLVKINADIAVANVKEQKAAEEKAAAEAAAKAAAEKPKAIPSTSVPSYQEPANA